MSEVGRASVWRVERDEPGEKRDFIALATTLAAAKAVAENHDSTDPVTGWVHDNGPGWDEWVGQARTEFYVSEEELFTEEDCRNSGWELGRTAFPPPTPAPAARARTPMADLLRLNPQVAATLRTLPAARPET